MKRIGEGEIILYRSPKIENKKAMIFSTFLMIGGLDAFFSFILIYSLDDLYFMILSVCVLFFLINPILLLFMIRDEKKVCFFVLTDKNLYISHHKSDLTLGRVDSHRLNSFNGINFRKRFFDKNYNSGTIEFITDDLIPKKILIRNVPNIPKLQNIIESIFFYYGNVQERWKQINDSVDYQFPQIYEISEVKLKELKKSKIIDSIILTLTPIICYLLYFIIRFFIKNLILPVVVISCGVAFAIFISIQIFSMINRTSNKDNQLIINENDFLLKKKKRSLSVPINKAITLNILHSKGPLVSHRNILENYDFIKIYKSYNSKNVIKFGPFTKLPYIFSFLYCYLLVWKSNYGYLISKDEIPNL